MVEIIDYYGIKREFSPESYANPEAFYPKDTRPFLPRLILEGEFNVKDDSAVLDFWQSADRDIQYLYRKMELEILTYLGWRKHNGYHQYKVSLDEYILATEKEGKLTSYTFLYKGVDSAAANALLVPSNRYKAFFWGYAVCVMEQPIAVADNACKDQDALSYFKKYGELRDSKYIWKDWLDKRISKERRKLSLD